MSSIHHTGIVAREQFLLPISKIETLTDLKC